MSETLLYNNTSESLHLQVSFLRDGWTDMQSWHILIYITTMKGAKSANLGARVKVGVSLAPSWCPGTKKVGAKFRT